MQFKRQEPFRYAFGTPLPCEFQIIKVNGEEQRSSTGEAELLDLSLTGLKLSTELDIPENQEDLFVECTFTITEKPITVRAQVLWKKDHVTEYWYGLHFSAEETIQRQLVNDLKHFARTAVASEE